MQTNLSAYCPVVAGNVKEIIFEHSGAYLLYSPPVLHHKSMTVSELETESRFLSTYKSRFNKPLLYHFTYSSMLFYIFEYVVYVLEGVFYDKEKTGYRTPKSNTFFHSIKTESRNYKNNKSDNLVFIPICRLACG